MALATSIIGGNKILGAPKGMEHEVDSLEVFSSVPYVTSCWKLSEGELEEIALTGKIFLTIRGETMPPAYVATESDMRIFLAQQNRFPDQDE